LTADLVIVIFHPPGFFVLELADRIELLGFAQLPPFGGVASAYVCALIAFKEQGLEVTPFNFAMMSDGESLGRQFKNR